ncbi:MAG: hypothetical protein CMM03_03935 [Rhodopirellula sp.]|nr:hypothetical protein [Rhodopirellula sp.]
MVNSSLNWASILGIVLIFWTPFISIAGVERISRTGKPKALWALIIGRYVFGQLCAGILFFQGWRLDPILQFSQLLLVLGLIVESGYAILRDGFSLNGDAKRHKAAFEYANRNQVQAPKKSILLWYFLTLITLPLPFLGGLIVLFMASHRFGKVEKRLVELDSRNI